MSRYADLPRHVRALKNGVTAGEIRAIILQATAYAGIPAGVESFPAAAAIIDAPD